MKQINGLSPETFHVVPVNDIRVHDMSLSCHCKPYVERYENGNKMVVHNSYDGREFYEDHYRA